MIISQEQFNTNHALLDSNFFNWDVIKDVQGDIWNYKHLANSLELLNNRNEALFPSPYQGPSFTVHNRIICANTMRQLKGMVKDILGCGGDYDLLKTTHTAVSNIDNVEKNKNDILKIYYFHLKNISKGKSRDESWTSKSVVMITFCNSSRFNDSGRHLVLFDPTKGSSSSYNARISSKKHSDDYLGNYILNYMIRKKLGKGRQIHVIEGTEVANNVDLAADDQDRSRTLGEIVEHQDKACLEFIRMVLLSLNYDNWNSKFDFLAPPFIRIFKKKPVLIPEAAGVSDVEMDTLQIGNPADMPVLNPEVAGVSDMIIDAVVIDNEYSEIEDMIAFQTPSIQNSIENDLSLRSEDFQQEPQPISLNIPQQLQSLTPNPSPALLPQHPPVISQKKPNLTQPIPAEPVSTPPIPTKLIRTQPLPKRARLNVVYNPVPIPTAQIPTKSPLTEEQCLRDILNIILYWNCTNLTANQELPAFTNVKYPNTFTMNSFFEDLQNLVYLEIYKDMVASAVYNQSFTSSQIKAAVQDSGDTLALVYLKIGIKVNIGDLVILRSVVESYKCLGYVNHFEGFACAIKFSREHKCYFHEKSVEMAILFSTTSSFRELNAIQYAETQRSPMICALEECKLAPITLNADDKHDAYYKYLKLNESQITGIRKSCSLEEGFNLIHGPPGTGKTTTIAALANSLIEQDGINRVLIVANSNHAANNIVKRILEFKEKNKLIGCLKNEGTILRFGMDDKMEESQLDVSFGCLYRKKIMLSVQSDTNDQCLRDSIFYDFVQKNKEIIDSPWNENIRKEIEIMHRNFVQYYHIDEKMIRVKMFDECKVLVTTLNSSGHEYLKSVEWDHVIIEEASQATIPSCMIPLKDCCKKGTMVGDHLQLPPTVKSKVAISMGYGLSPFDYFLWRQDETLDNNNNINGATTLLSTQYRMHPTISDFPRRYIYNNKVFDAENLEFERTKGWHNDSYYGVLQFYNIESAAQKDSKKSTFNLNEIKVIVEFTKEFIRKYVKLY